jgi:hypothetical protein
LLHPIPLPKDYKPEFKELGAERVRMELLKRRWDPDKLAAARIWVENADTHNWVSDRKDTPAGGKNNFRKWAVIIAGVFGFLFVAARILKMMAR